MKKQILKIRKLAVMLCSMQTVQSVIAQETSNKATNQKQASLINPFFTIYGNCGICKKWIEKAALSVGGVEKAIWDVETNP